MITKNISSKRDLVEEEKWEHLFSFMMKHWKFCLRKRELQKFLGSATWHLVDMEKMSWWKKRQNNGQKRDRWIEEKTLAEVQFSRGGERRRMRMRSSEEPKWSRGFSWVKYMRGAIWCDCNPQGSGAGQNWQALWACYSTLRQGTWLVSACQGLELGS